jgi:hypothetical protein
MRLTDEEQHKIALFRFSCISDLLDCSFDYISLDERCRELASKVRTLPDGSQRKYPTRTYKKWYRAYKDEESIEGLLPDRKRRASDRARTFIRPEAITAMKRLASERPPLTKSQIYRSLVGQGLFESVNSARKAYSKCMSAEAAQEKAGEYN